MMSGARHRDGWLVALLLAGSFALALGSGAASAAVGAGHANGHVGGFAGGSHPDGSFPRGRQFGAGRLDGRRVPHGRAGREVFVFPYFYDPYPYFYDPYFGYGPYYTPYSHAPYCDPSLPSYASQYCDWDDSP
jgi:hypothetical protein